jgi:hypothetical protein
MVDCEDSREATPSSTCVVAVPSWELVPRLAPEFLLIPLEEASVLKLGVVLERGTRRARDKRRRCPPTLSAGFRDEGWLLPAILNVDILDYNGTVSPKIARKEKMR